MPDAPYKLVDTLNKYQNFYPILSSECYSDLERRLYVANRTERFDMAGVAGLARRPHTGAARQIFVFGTTGNSRSSCQNIELSVSVIFYFEHWDPCDEWRILEFIYRFAPRYMREASTTSTDSGLSSDGSTSQQTCDSENGGQKVASEYTRNRTFISASSY